MIAGTVFGFFIHAKLDAAVAVEEDAALDDGVARVIPHEHGRPVLEPQPRLHMHVPKDAVAHDVAVATVNVHALRVALIRDGADVSVFDEAVLDDAVLGSDAAWSAAGAFHELFTGVEESEIAHPHGPAAEPAMQHDGVMEEFADGHVGDERTFHIVELETRARHALRILLPRSANDDVLAFPGLATEGDVAQRLRCLGTQHEIVGDAVFTRSEHDGLSRFHGPDRLFQFLAGFHTHHLAVGRWQRGGGFLFEQHLGDLRRHARSKKASSDQKGQGQDVGEAGDHEVGAVCANS